MKKIYASFILFLGISGLTHAQVTLTESNHAHSVGDVLDMYQLDSTGINPGASGTSVSWNFSAIPIRTNVPVSTTYTIVSSVASGSLYPSASVVGTNSNSKMFYSSNSNQLNFWGGNFNALSFSVDYYFNTPAVHALYPLAYNTTTNSAFSGSLQQGSNSGSISNGTSTVIADGTGTLNVSGRTFSNVMRVNTYTGFDWSVPAFFANGNVKQRSWEFYSTLTNYPSSKLEPIFVIQTATIAVTSPTSVVQTSTLVLINKNYMFLGIDENIKDVANFEVYPNPAENNFNLTYLNENAEAASYELINVMGQTVRKTELSREKGILIHNEDLADLPSGIYFVRVHVGSKTSVKKLTIQ